jgi:hypothetical protein
MANREAMANNTEVMASLASGVNTHLHKYLLAHRPQPAWLVVKVNARHHCPARWSYAAA